MQHTDTHSVAEADAETFPSTRIRRRLAFVLTVILVVLLLAFIPPLINVSRLQRRIAHNISASIGRPVHFDRLSLTMLPSPGFTLENFAVNEDPAFGYEPILRANEVTATLRISSLWRGRPEFSTISFGDGTSVNLVHLSDGRWNIESLLFQAQHIPAAPTTQRHAGPAPRFPYIEATGARVNLKLDQDKTPFSLDQAEFALWEPESNQWRLRLAARPVRTDSSPSETGTFRIEGTLGSPNHTAGTFAATAIDLRGDWREAQLGGLSQFVTGSDAGLRGDIEASFGLHGNVALNTITTDISVRNARRAEFIPPEPLTLQARCQAQAGQTFHSFTGIACYWPPPESADTSTLIIAAEVPDVRTPDTATVRVTLPAVPASTFFNWVSVASRHPPTGLAGPGTLSGELLWGRPDTGGSNNQSPGAASLRSKGGKETVSKAAASQTADQSPGAPSLRSKGGKETVSDPADHTPSWIGELEFSGGSVSLDGQPPVALGDIVLQSTQRPQQNPGAPSLRSKGGKQNVALAPPPHDSFDLQPVSLDLGGKSPATLTGHVDDTGYTLHLTGSVLPSRLLAVGKAIPQLGDGLADCLPSTAPANDASTNSPPPAVPESPIQVDLTGNRRWGSAQTWCPTAEPAAPTR